MWMLELGVPAEEVDEPLASGDEVSFPPGVVELATMVDSESGDVENTVRWQFRNFDVEGQLKRV